VDSKLEFLQFALGVRFDNPALLRQSLVHRSYLNETDLEDEGSNERLEFLGDAVLGLVVAEELFRRYPEVSEGDLTEMRAQLVRGAALAPVGARLELGSYLVLGHGEEQSGGRRRRINLARAIEAVLGAVYLDRGLDETREVVRGLMAPEFERVAPDRVRLDPKSRLQQLAQSDYHVTPRYVTTGDAGSGEARQFMVEVHFGQRAMGAGAGPNKRVAQQEAARAALAALTGEEQPPLPESASGQTPLRSAGRISQTRK
jgi:ribonuclease-3